ncbi:MAG TPA: DUF2341 domain-containing protein [Acetobacteraceae bacterium]|jgi:biopolymer transport protein ExbB
MMCRIAALPGRFRHVLGLASVGLLAQLLLAHPAYAWWNGDWSYREKIVADATPKGANITQPVGRTQILVRLHSGNFNFATAKDDGTDLRFVAGDDRTPLHYHLEKFDGLIDQVALAWVDVPDLAPGTSTTIYMYWGHKNATNASDPRGTYDADQVLVYHFADDNGLPKDATGYGNNALTPGKRDNAGLIGGGVRLDGTAPILLPQSASLAVAAGQAMTWSMWIHSDIPAAAPADGAAAAAPAAPGAPAPDASTAAAGGQTPPPAAATPAAPPAASTAAPNAILYSQRDGANALTIGIDQGVVYAQVETAAGVQRTSAGAPLAADGWHHIAVEESDKLTVYVDGQARGDVVAPLPALAGQALLGGAAAPPAAPAATPDAAAAASATTPPAAPAAPGASSPAPATPASPADASAAPATPPPAPNFVGQIDEFEIAKVARPIGAFQVAVADQGPDPKLLTMDVAEQSSFFGSGYIGIIIRSVTPDAWVVIGILGIMAIVSWAVMIGKARYLGRVTKANRAFATAFSLAMAQHEDGRSGFHSISAATQPVLVRSSLYRLYAVGSRELSERLSRRRHKRHGMLTPQALAAIRASLDGCMAREAQRLNRLMVLLTIAISGGPFLGLLGTVVGVMITFAAIAQAGDVNVNAIAPGVSAALLATVAGLAVAIPALFAYNYFNSRIRDVMADMQIFVDELATRMAEGFDAPLASADDDLTEAAE